MKRILFYFLLSIISFQVSFAQEDAEKTVKKAAKALNAFNLEPAAKGASLDEAKTLIDQAFQSETVKILPSAWITKGQIYSGFLLKDQTARLLNPAYKSTLDFPASFIAYESFAKGLELSTKKFEKSDALKGMGVLLGDLNNSGNDLYNAGKYADAFKNFTASLDIHEKMKAAEQPSALDKPEDLQNQYFIIAAAAVKGKMFKEAKMFNDKLLAANYLDGGIYENQYEILMSEGNSAEAEKALEAGRVKVPDDVGLMFKEINHYIKQGRLDLLVGKIKSAIDKEPNNITLYTTLGNVYDNLYTKDSITIVKDATGNYTVMGSITPNENYKNAELYFTKATTIDTKNADALYGLGAFYYNVAARMTAILNKLADDYSKEGTKKYEAIKTEVFTMFDKSLPSFKASEALNPNERNSLIALKEIFARKNEFDLSNEFKARLEKLEGGGKNETSYYKN